MAHPKRPYFLRAFYEWCINENNTPYLAVNASYDNLVIPEDYVQDGQIVFNISENATQNLVMDNLFIEFDASFGGTVYHVHIPTIAVLFIYSKETSLDSLDGYLCEYEEYYDKQFDEDYAAATRKSTSPSTGHLKIIK